MTKRIFRSILAVSLAVLLASSLLIVGVLHGYFQDSVLADLTIRTAYIAHGIENEGIVYLKEDLPGGCRITLVDTDGTVLYDNREDPAQMENHADREEIHEAAMLGQGRAVRHSDTLSEKTIYYALRLSDGTILRVSDTEYSVWRLVIQAMQPMALVLVLAFVLALVLASRVSRQLVQPINALDLSQPGDQAPYEELAPLLGKIRSQNRQIQKQMLDLKQRQEEFATITENMSEGFLVIDQETRVLSYNSAALRLLRGSVEGPAPDTAFALNREAGFRRCVEDALAGRRREELLEKDSSCRQVIASPVEQDGAIAGAVLVVLDVTEKEQRESLRREFTANVSHELKTPLTSILGTAEILQNGLVKPEDVSHFAGNIHREAGRLIGLVNNIIKLSRLDEGGPTTTWENVDLYQTAKSALDRLSAAAEQRQVTLELRGEPVQIHGVPQIVDEILYNLCDNAVVYNRPGGKVCVTVEDTGKSARVMVEDTGIGIPQEVQSRVFERFYRVDKSHSAGGTGLGLSIVKHGAAYLGAKVTLESEEGKGSTFTLIFPKSSI